MKEFKNKLIQQCEADRISDGRVPASAPEMDDTSREIDQPVCLAMIGGGPTIRKAIEGAYKDLGFSELVVVDSQKATDIRGDAQRIANANIVIVLTKSGDDVKQYANYGAVQPGQIWLDDTFPEMTNSTRVRLQMSGATVYKLSAVDGEVWSQEY